MGTGSYFLRVRNVKLTTQLYPVLGTRMVQVYHHALTSFHDIIRVLHYLGARGSAMNEAL
jgi:hypothetical protein